MSEFDGMPEAVLLRNITQLKEDLHAILDMAYKRGMNGHGDSAALYAQNAGTTLNGLLEAQAMLARMDDATKVKNASNLLDILKKTDGATEEEARRCVLHARDYLRDVMGAK